MKKLLIIIMLTFSIAACSMYQNSADLIIQAENSNKLIPVLSTQSPALDVEKAYQVQKEYIEKKIASDKIAGFKAGLTSKGAQKKFGISDSVAGVLLESGKLIDNAVIDSSKFHRLMLETEIGFVIGKTISQQVNDIDTLKSFIKAVMPVIEVPDLGFSDMSKLKGVDIIAANVAAKQFIVGQQQAVSDDLNSVIVTLSHDGKEINRGKGSDAIGDQWQAALWLVNTMIEKGWVLEPGQIIITGALGKLLPGKPGKYLADYGNFGKITFEIK